MRISLEGAATGAAVTALGRALVMIGWLGWDLGSFLALPSAGIGLLVGAIAGAIGKPVHGAVAGFFLSALIFELFSWSCASGFNLFGSLVGEQQAGREILLRLLPYMLLMGVAGAVGGGIGGLVGQSNLRQQAAREKLAPPQDQNS
jgi:hypothetical protein